MKITIKRKLPANNRQISLEEIFNNVSNKPI